MTLVNMIRGRQTVLFLTNKSGGSVVAGDVVIVDTTNDAAFTTTTSGQSLLAMGVVQESIANNATGRVCVAGYVPLVNVPASVTRGHFIETHTVAKQATGNSTRRTGTFGRFLTGGTTPTGQLYGLVDTTAAAGSAVASDTIWDTKGDLAVATAADTAQKLAAGTNGLFLQADSAQTTGLVYARAGLLAVNYYAPTSLGTFSTTSATMADVDATNMKVDFTVPITGNVLIRLSAFADMNGAAGEGYWGIRESTTDLFAARMLRAGATADGYYAVAFYKTGLTAGDSKTYKWSFAVATAVTQTQRILVQDGTAHGDFPPAVMEVWAAP